MEDAPRSAAPERTGSPQASASGRAICVCVDDFGLHAGIDEAALALVGMRRVQAVGCMVGGGSWPAGSRLLRGSSAAALDIGLHLDLTECPLQPRSLRPLGALIASSMLRRLDRKALRAEIRAQCDAFEAAVGRPPAFVDGHQHVHQLPIVRSELLDELLSRYAGSLPWLRSTRRARIGRSRQGWRDTVKPWGIAQLGARSLATLARRQGFAQNRHLLGVYDFEGGPGRHRDLLAGWLDSSVDGDLLMCHPSLMRQDIDPIVAARHAEYEVLCSPDFADLVHDAGIALLPMSRILAGRHQPSVMR